jgi:hypothetical protein
MFALVLPMLLISGLACTKEKLDAQLKDKTPNVKPRGEGSEDKGKPGWKAE